MGLLCVLDEIAIAIEVKEGFFESGADEHHENVPHSTENSLGVYMQQAAVYESTHAHRLIDRYKLM